MGHLSVKYLLSKQKIMFKKSISKIKPESPLQIKVDTYLAPIFAPDHSADVLVAKMCTNQHEHSIQIRFLCGKAVKPLKNRHFNHLF
jgi:hypothetical protein